MLIEIKHSHQGDLLLIYTVIDRMKSHIWYIIFATIILITCIPQSYASRNNGDIDEKVSENKNINVAMIDRSHLEKLSTEERDWYEKFQNGLMFFDGWQEISEDILSCLPPEEQSTAKYMLETLGVRIGTEWSRNNTIRKINTDQLHDWGERLKESKHLGPAIVAETLNLIASEVDSLLVE